MPFRGLFDPWDTVVGSFLKTKHQFYTTEQQQKAQSFVPNYLPV